MKKIILSLLLPMLLYAQTTSIKNLKVENAFDIGGSATISLGTSGVINFPNYSSVNFSGNALNLGGTAVNLIGPVSFGSTFDMSGSSSKVGYANGGSNASTQSGLTANAHGAKGWASGTALEAGAADFAGQLQFTTDGISWSIARDTTAGDTFEPAVCLNSLMYFTAINSGTIASGQINAISTTGAFNFSNTGSFVDNSLVIVNQTGGFSGMASAQVYLAARLAFTGQPSNGQVVVVGGKTYAFQTTLTNVDGNVKIGASLLVSIQNLAAAVNLDTGSGTAYAAAMTAGQSLATAETASIFVWASPALNSPPTITTSTTVTGATWTGALGSLFNYDTIGATAIATNSAAYNSTASDYNGFFLATNPSPNSYGPKALSANGNPTHITISQEQGPNSNSHRRLYFETPLHGSNYAIHAYGWTTATNGGDYRIGPFGWYLGQDGRMGIGTETLNGGAQLTIAGRVDATGLNIGSGTTASRIKHGTSGALTAGSIVISDASVTANTRLFFTVHTRGTVSLPQSYDAATRTPGTSFTITSSSAIDTSTVDYLEIEP